MAGPRHFWYAHVSLRPLKDWLLPALPCRQHTTIRGPQGGTGSVFRGDLQLRLRGRVSPAGGVKEKESQYWRNPVGQRPRYLDFIRKKIPGRWLPSITGHTFLNSAFYQEGPLFPLYTFSPSRLQTSRILCLLISWACSLERRRDHVPHGGKGCGG